MKCRVFLKIARSASPHAARINECLPRSSQNLTRRRAAFCEGICCVNVLILIFVAIGCASRQISEEQIETCLTRTDWPEHNVAERAAIAWLVDYETEESKTPRCCALEPRPSVLAKRGELKELNAELLNAHRCKFEAGSDAAKRAQSFRLAMTSVTAR
jgi:hypothetical protein